MDKKETPIKNIILVIVLTIVSSSYDKTGKPMKSVVTKIQPINLQDRV